MSIQRRDRPATANWVCVSKGGSDGAYVMPVPGGMIVLHLAQQHSLLAESMAFVPCAPEQMENFIKNSVFQREKAEEDGA